MKTYKHKVHKTITTYKDGVFKQDNICVEIGCEPSSEFWEELTYEIITEKPSANIGSNKIEIIEVKRLSDNVVFKRGDLTNAGEIEIFTLCGEHLIVKTDGGLITFDNYLCLKKQPILTTEDGVELTTNDEYYTVYTMQDSRYKTWETQDTPFIVNGKKEDYVHGIVKYFAKKENAEEYIRLNEPKYSLNDMTKIANHWAYIKVVTPEHVLKTIEKW